MYSIEFIRLGDTEPVEIAKPTVDTRTEAMEIARTEICEYFSLSTVTLSPHGGDLLRVKFGDIPIGLVKITSL